VLLSRILIGWLVGWLVGWLDGWLVGWLDGWLVGWLVTPLALNRELIPLPLLLHRLRR
jgi:hypothetical protein